MNDTDAAPQVVYPILNDARHPALTDDVIVAVTSLLQALSQTPSSQLHSLYGAAQHVESLVDHPAVAALLAPIYTRAYEQMGCRHRLHTLFRCTRSTLPEYVSLSRPLLSQVCVQTFVSLAMGMSIQALYTEPLQWEDYVRIARWIERVLLDRPMYRFDRQRFMTPKRLRIGLVTPDCCHHSLMPLLGKVLLHAITSSPHLWYLWYTRPHRDDVTEMFAASVHQFKHAYTMSDADIADDVYRSEIDILVDISGMTEYTRINVFARRPAPVAVGWGSGMMTPSGFSFIPYFITDRVLNAYRVVDTVAKPYELSVPYTYHPFGLDIPRHAGLDAAKSLRTSVTFGCFNNPIKLNRSVIETWADILKRVPSSTLHVRVSNEQVRTTFQAWMSARGVTHVDQRVICVPESMSNRDAIRHYIERVDILLDPWPCTGCLTTVEAFWFAKPVICYAGKVPIERQGVPAAKALHVDNLLVAESREDYIEKAVFLATSPSTRHQVMQTLYERLPTSDVCNYAKIAHELITTLESIWADACTVYQ